MPTHVDGVTETSGGGGTPTSYDPVSYHPAIAEDWTARSPSGGGVASVSGGELVLTQPASPTTGDAHRASLMRSLAPDVGEGSPFEVSCRINSLASQANVELTIQINEEPDGTTGRELRVLIGHAGAVSIGYLTKGPPGDWHSVATGGSIPLDGTGYVCVRVYARHAEVLTATSGDPDALDWTPCVSSVWDAALSGSGWGTSTPPGPWRYWGVALTAYTSTPGAEAHIDHASIRRL